MTAPSRWTRSSGCCSSAAADPKENIDDQEAWRLLVRPVRVRHRAGRRGDQHPVGDAVRIYYDTEFHTRPDGQPDRPLTAFNLMVENLP